MKKLQISFNASVAVGNGLTISGGGNEITLIAAAEESSDSNTFYGGTTGTEAAEAFAESLRVSNANSKSLGPLVIGVSTSVVSITFADANITTASASSVGTVNVTTTSSDVDNNIYDYDKKIMARSPHFYGVRPPSYGDKIDSAELHIYAYQGSRYTDRPSTPTYVIRSVASLDQLEILFNISEFAKSFFTQELAESGTEANWNPFIDIFPFYTQSGELYSLDPDFGIAYNGYGYFEDGVNPQNEGSLAQSNSHIIALDGGTSSYAISATETVKVVEEKDGEVISVENISNDITFSTNAILSKKFGYIGINLKDLVRDKGSGVNYEYFYNSAAEEFVNQNSITGPDKIYLENIDGSIKTVKVSYIKECKYNPMKLTFTNKFGALQSLWFFKNSSESMKTEQDSFRRNTLSEYGSYSIQDHQYKNLYKSGKQSITLSSGFYPESHNELFKQLMLSQDVWLQRDGEVLPVNISDSSIDFKTSLNEKLIEYTVKCDFAFDTINSIN